MRTLPTLFLLAICFAMARADDAASSSGPPPDAGIIILKAVAGYPATAVQFVSIQWTDTNGGVVADRDGKRTSFLNDAIGRIIYFDLPYYEEVDHNQNWVNWRAGLQSREVVAPPVDLVTLSAQDVPHLQKEQAILQDAIMRYPAGQPLVQPIIDLIKADTDKLTSGQVLQNGQWIAANQASASSGGGPQVVGDVNAPVTFTSKDGKKFVNARVMLNSTGVSVITSDGGASLGFDQLPDDLSGFPDVVRKKVEGRRASAAAQAAEDAKAAAPAPTAASDSSDSSADSSTDSSTTKAGSKTAATTTTAKVTDAAKNSFDAVKSFTSGLVTKVWSYFGSTPDKSTSSTNQPAATPPSPANPTKPAAPALAAPATNAAKPTPPVTPATAPTPASAPVPTVSTMDPNAVVLIKGDNGQGTGFLTKTAQGPVVITNLHVVAANPNLKILTSSGAEIVPLSMKGASDRDLAMFLIQDNHYTYLEMAADVAKTTSVNDPLIISGDSEGGEVTLKTNGKVVAIGPQRVEFDNPIYHGNSGGPLFDTKTGKVVGAVVGASMVTPRDVVDKSSFANANSAIKGPMRYFGLRLDTVPEWQDYDQNLFGSETNLLKNFHEESRALDSFLNGAGYEKQTWAHDEGAPDSKYYLTNPQVRKAEETYQRTLEEHDKRTALQELAWSLGTLADDNLAAVRDPSRFYPYDQDRAKYELEYRMALKGEIQKIQDIVNNTSGASSHGNFGL
jgi:hypothetical protein